MLLIHRCLVLKIIGTQKHFFLWWPGFELRTLHILCIVHTNWDKLTRTWTQKHLLYGIYFHDFFIQFMKIKHAFFLNFYFIEQLKFHHLLIIFHIINFSKFLYLKETIGVVKRILRSWNNYHLWIILNFLMLKEIICVVKKVYNVHEITNIYKWR